MAVFRSADAHPLQAARRTSTGEHLGLYVDISEVAELSKMQVFREKLLPGRRSSPPHFHTVTEEFVYVIEGRVNAVVNGKTTELRAGDAIGFPAGSAETHFLRNDHNVAAVLLVTRVSSNDDRVVFSPKLTGMLKG